MNTPISRQWIVMGLAVSAALLITLILARAPLVSGSDIHEPAPPPARALTATEYTTVCLPLVMNQSSMAEVRALWVTRYDWTRYGYTATASDVQQIVSDAVRAGF